MDIISTAIKILVFEVQMSKNVYIRCPRCELNFIVKKDKFCQVCKQEMQALATNFADESGKEMGLCPICKVNFVTEDETVCSTCMSETDLTEDELDTLYGGVAVHDGEESKDEESLSDGDDDEELEIISLADMGEDGDEEDETDEEASSDPLDDFDASYVDDEEEDEEDEDDVDDEDDK